MELTILTTIFISLNLWGIYAPIPLTNINPSRSPLERSISSFQAVSTIHVLRKIHPKVFPEVNAAATDTPDPNNPLKRDDILNGVMEEYAQDRNLTMSPPSATATATATLVNNSAQPLTISHLLRENIGLELNVFDDVTDAVWTVFCIAILGLSVLIILCKELGGFTGHGHGRPPISDNDASSKTLNDIKELISLIRPRFPIQHGDSKNYSDASSTLGSSSPTLKDVQERLARVEGFVVSQKDTETPSPKQYSQSGSFDERIKEIENQLRLAENKLSIQLNIKNMLEETMPAFTTKLIQQLKNWQQSGSSDNSSPTENILNQIDDLRSLFTKSQGDTSNDVDRQQNLENSIGKLREDLTDLQNYLQSKDLGTSQKSLEERISSLETATSTKPMDEAEIDKALSDLRKDLDDLQDKIDDNERNIEEMITMNYLKSLGLPERDEFERMIKDINSTKQKLDELPATRQPQGFENDELKKVEADINSIRSNLQAIKNTHKTFQTQLTNIDQKREAHEGRLRSTELSVQSQQTTLNQLNSGEGINTAGEPQDKDQNLRALGNRLKTASESISNHGIQIQTIDEKLGRMHNTLSHQNSDLAEVMAKLGILYRMKGTVEAMAQTSSTATESQPVDKQTHNDSNDEPNTTTEEPSTQKADNRKDITESESPSYAGPEGRPYFGLPSQQDNAEGKKPASPKQPPSGQESSPGLKESIWADKEPSFGLPPQNDRPKVSPKKSSSFDQKSSSAPTGNSKAIGKATPPTTPNTNNNRHGGPPANAPTGPAARKSVKTPVESNAGPAPRQRNDLSLSKVRAASGWNEFSIDAAPKEKQKFDEEQAEIDRLKKEGKYQPPSFTENLKWKQKKNPGDSNSNPMLPDPLSAGTEYHGATSAKEQTSSLVAISDEITEQKTPANSNDKILESEQPSSSRRPSQQNNPKDEKLATPNLDRAGDIPESSKKSSLEEKPSEQIPSSGAERSAWANTNPISVLPSPHDNTKGKERESPKINWAEEAENSQRQSPSEKKSPPGTKAIIWANAGPFTPSSSTVPTVSTATTAPRNHSNRRPSGVYTPPSRRSSSVVSSDIGNRSPKGPNQGGRGNRGGKK
ncbi:hypothetical protein MW887_001686 [Aspergillus wentii]|nr:hypothetical protein MW887_001686 [Aspergillus wentii]